MTHSKYKILFVTQHYHPIHLADDRIYIVEPIQYEVLASMLDKDEVDISLLDQRLDRRPLALLETIRRLRPNFVGFTSWTMHVDLVRMQAALVKQIDPSIIVAVGGHHASLSPSDFADPNIDYVMMGEAYLSFRDLILRCRESERNVADLAGVAWQDNGKFFSNGKAVVPKSFDLDSLPLPDRSILGKYKGRYYHLWWKPVAALRTSMGCPARCSFCNLWRPNLGKYLTWSPEYIVEYLKTIEEPYVIFTDDHFFGDGRRAHAIGEAILRAGIKKEYLFYSRADAIVRDPSLVALWSRVGLKRLRMGLESYSDSELGAMEKGSSVAHNDRAIEILKKNDVLIEGLFIVGVDYKREQFENLTSYIRSRKVDIPNITVATPMPGTTDYAKNEDALIYKNPTYYDFQHAVLPTRLDIKEFCHLYGKMLLKVQRPPLEQIRRIGLFKFICNVPSFWIYFLRVYTSYKHYGYVERSGGELPTLPWVDMRRGSCGGDAVADKKYGSVDIDKVFPTGVPS
ncbi:MULTISPECIES: B12-binding domain-containing radical SAM protein [unclassified Bradyrhizobium]|uniref:B12-binding domain-containing radical SAM protein n=1 Tax=Bradyrhizobium TaxID=374 RepID=UPI0028ED6733|nr:MULTISPECIES: radical SAM protein [unclassified Bradyrhizobium]